MTLFGPKFIKQIDQMDIKPEQPRRQSQINLTNKYLRELKKFPVKDDEFSKSKVNWDTLEEMYWSKWKPQHNPEEIVDTTYEAIIQDNLDNEEESLKSQSSEQIYKPAAKFSDEGLKILKHTDSFILNSKKILEGEKEADLPKTIRLHKPSSSYYKGGSYPLKSCIKKDVLSEKRRGGFSLLTNTTLLRTIKPKPKSKF